MPHVTTEGRQAGAAARGPWLISLPFYAMCLAHVPAEGITIGELLERGFLDDAFLLGTNPGMVRWGYLQLERGSSRASRPDASWLVRLRAAGRQAQELWTPVPDIVEQRWAARWPTVRQLRLALEELVGQFDSALPDHVPINGGHHGRVSVARRPPSTVTGSALSALLAKALVRLTIEVEETSPLPLVHAANLGRVLADGPLARRELSHATGVAKETLAVMVGILEKRRVLAPGAHNAIALTAGGRDDVAATFAARENAEGRWRSASLRGALEPLVGTGTLEESPLRVAVEPPRGTWRRRRKAPTTLPHHPVVSHRGGFPDGA